MGIRESYESGTFCWVDLATTDPAGGKDFYGALFGWSFVDVPTGEGVYSMAMYKESQVAALYQLPPLMAAMNIPTHGKSYIRVDDIDAAVQKVKDAEGTVVMPPFDVMTAGKMALIQDPVGAPVSLWQPKEHCGAQRMNEVNTWCWNELDTHDVETSKSFFQQVFGWQYEEHKGGEMPYWNIMHYGKMMAGLMPFPSDVPQEVPSHWLVYFNVENTEAAVSHAKEKGASVIKDTFDVEPGPMAILQDPQGGVFSVIALREVDE